ncbi:MAG: PAS domain S-box protein, partial [Bacteroidota bacterium]|nr:PAS domain S-box protein [Bacteroidota bacterium]
MVMHRAEKKLSKDKINQTSRGNSVFDTDEGSLAKLEKIFAAAPDSYLLLSPDLIIQMATDAYLAIFNFKKEAIVGRYVMDLFPENISAEVEKAFGDLRASLQQVLATKKPHQIYIQQFDLPDPIKTGAFVPKYWLALNTPVLNEEGEIQFIIHKVEDVTDRFTQKQQEAELNTQELEQQKSYELVNNIEVIFVELDFNEKFLFLNKTGEKYFNKKKEELIGKNIWLTYPEAVGTAGYTAIREALTERKKTETEYFSAVFKKYMFLSAVPSDEGVIILFYDRHDIKEAHQKLAEEHRRMNEAQAIGHVGSFEWNLQTNITFWSDEMYRIHGFEPKAGNITLEKVFSLTYPQDREHFLSVFRQLKEKAKGGSFTHRIVREDGTIRVLNRHFQSFANAEGKVTLVKGTVQDITDKIQTEKRIWESERLLSTAEEIGQIGSYELDVTTLTFRFSDGMFQLFGEEPQTFTPTLDFIDSRSIPEDAAKVREVLNQATLNKKPYYYTRRIKRKDGEWRLLESHGKVICNDEGAAIRFIGMVQDITELRNAENTIHQMVQGSVAGIALLQAVRDEAGKIIDFVYKGVNKSVERLTGYTAEQLLNNTYLELSPNAKKVFFDTFVKVVETGEMTQVKQHYPYEQFGKDTWFDATAIKNGDGIILTFLDISEQKKTERQLQEQAYYLRRITETVPDVV